MSKIRLTKKQLSVLNILLFGGKIIVYDCDELFLSDCDLNDYNISRPTFKRLLNEGFIDCCRSLSLRADEYSLTKKGQQFLSTIHSYPLTIS